MFTPFRSHLGPPPSLPNPADIIRAKRDKMRNSMLRGGHAWETVKEAIEEAYPISEIDAKQNQYLREAAERHERYEKRLREINRRRSMGFWESVKELLELTGIVPRKNPQ